MQAPGDALPPPQEDPHVADAMASDAAVPLRYSAELFEAFGAVGDKAKAGVQSCQAVAAFVHDRTNMEAAYARAMTKIAANAKSDDWAPGFAKSWQIVQDTLTELGKLHTESAAKMQSTMVAGARAFAAQQEIQVQRLIAEGTKFRTAHQNMMQTMERAKDKYDKRCAEAIELVAAMQRRADSMDGSSSPSPSPSALGSMPLAALASPPSTLAISLAIDTASPSDDSKEIVGQLLTKMWDTTSSFTKPSMERQRSKLESSLEELLAAEKQYKSSVDYVNSQRLVVEREIAENLHAFQLTEEQRIEYLKDLLLRLQRMLLRNVEASRSLVEKLRDGTNDINEFVDIEDGFRQLSRDVDPDTQLLDPSDNAFFQRMCQVQTMSDRGHHVVRTIASTITELMAIEDHFVSSSQRLLRAHDAPATSTGDLFNLSAALSQVCSEGSTMSAGWKATKQQTQCSSEVHLEFKSLLAESVALNIASMKQEYESARVTTHENFSKTHGALCHDAATHQKRKQKMDIKTREFAQAFASLPDMGEIDLRNLDVTHVLALVHQLSSTFSDKEKRIESKLKQVGEEVRDAQQKMNESLAVLKQRSVQYIQDVDVFISVYMKNEKFRLQVEKSSLQSLAKALAHTVEGAAIGIENAISALELIDPSTDVTEFVRAHRTPHGKSKKITPSYHNDEGLQAALEEYHRSRTKTPVASPEERKAKPPGDASAVHAGLIKRTSSTSAIQSSASAIEKTLKSALSSVMDEDKDPLMEMSDFQKKFKLENPEQIVESYSCALYATGNNFPNHGRIYLTTDHICFAGWRETIYVASYLDIVLMEKKNTAIIVPNAIEITTTNGDKNFFASFVFRDECLQCLQQLQAIKKATAAAMAESLSISTENSDERLDAPVEVPSPTSEAPVAPSPQPTDEPIPAPAPTITVAEPVSQTPPLPAASSPAKPQPPAPRVIPDKDLLLSEFEVVVDEEVPFSVEFAYASIWVESNAFFQRFLENGGETSISIAPWDKNAVDYTAVTKPDTFDGSRRVAYTHNKKYMVGPSSIPTMQTQRFKWQPNVRLTISVTTVVSDAPYCDYFRAENRWVFSTTAKDGVCRLQVGIGMQWVKSTWLKKQIESTAMGEAKEYTRALISAAVDASKRSSATTNGSTNALTPAPSASSASPVPVASEVASAESASAAVPTSRKSSAADTTDYPVVSKQPVAVIDQPAAVILPALPSASSTASSLSRSLLDQQRPLGIKSFLQLANLLCLVLFIFTMYRIGAALDQMQVLTREALVQQRQHQELFRDILLKLHDQNKRT